ncbi:MAG: hypothetical protein RLZZ621_1917 [Gemmatimonadota bacterium]
MALLTRRQGSPATTDDVFTGIMRRMLNDPLISTPFVNTATAWMPAVDVSENRDAIMLTAELPGIDEKNIRIDLDNNVLTIAGEKDQERREGDEDSAYFLSERFYGAFQRAFTLPRTVDVDNIHADFDKGVLKVTLPKLPQAKGRQIQIG